MVDRQSPIVWHNDMLEHRAVGALSPPPVAPVPRAVTLVVPHSMRRRSPTLECRRDHTRGSQDQAQASRQDPQRRSTASSSPTPAPSVTAGRSRRSACTTRRRTPRASRSTPSGRSTGWASARSRPSRCSKLLKLTGDWQKFKGVPAPAPLQVAEPKADRHAVYEAAAKEALSEATPARRHHAEGQEEGRGPRRHRRGRRGRRRGPGRAGRRGRSRRRGLRCSRRPSSTW